IIPLMPPLSILTGYWLDRHWESTIFLFRRIKNLVIFFGLFSVLSMGLLSFFAEKINSNSIKPVTETLKQQMESHTEIVAFYKYYQDLPLYLQRKITIVADWHAKDIPARDNWVREMWYGMPFQDTSEWLIGENIFWKRWYGSKPLIVLMDAKR